MKTQIAIFKKCAFWGFVALAICLLSSAPAAWAATTLQWETHTAAENNEWFDVIWSPELSIFVAVARNGTNRIMTSPDGINWTGRTAAAANSWMAVTWSPPLGIFVAVASAGNANRVMTSSDGVTWNAHPAAAASPWASVAWAPELGLFAAVADGGSQRIMTSSDGVSWTAQTAPEDNAWLSIAWSPQLGKFAAVAFSGPGTNRVMTGVPLATVSNAPLSLQAVAAGANQINLSWSAATSENPYSPPTGYKIERSVAAGPFEVLIANTNSTATTYQDTGLNPNTQYSYRVSAINTAGTSTPSNVASATTSDMLAPTGTLSDPLVPEGLQIERDCTHLAKDPYGLRGQFASSVLLHISLLGISFLN